MGDFETIVRNIEARSKAMVNIGGYMIHREAYNLIIEKAKRAFCKAKECVPYEECQRANGGCFAMQRFIKAMEE